MKDGVDNDDDNINVPVQRETDPLDPEVGRPGPVGPNDKSDTEDMDLVAVGLDVTVRGW